MAEVYQRVIIIDDEKIQHQVAKVTINRFFKGYAINIVSFCDPVKGLQYLQDENANKIPTVVFLDLCMPVLDGWAFLDQLTNTKPACTTIFIVSSSVSNTDIERAKSHPLVDDYVSKPIMESVENIFAPTLLALQEQHQ